VIGTRLTLPPRCPLGSHEAARLLRLAALLSAGPRTTADLARQLGVSQRTLQRGLQELPELRRDRRRDGRCCRLPAGAIPSTPPRRAEAS
jgi:predicted DNA-binding transcriptional regulator YafY